MMTLYVLDTDTVSAWQHKHPLVVARVKAVPGTELFVTDGTDAGTRQVKDIAPGDAPSKPQQLTAVGDELYFHRHFARFRLRALEE